ncbi:MAG: hypothetical protein LQ340_000855 [Diploschistes diacapsis]|nr:MAG: hypothetical protein LQ340_000855 [Diploschistes diacapsis]
MVFICVSILALLANRYAPKGYTKEDRENHEESRRASSISLFKFPKEIRMQILEYLLDTHNLKKGKWLAQPAFRINRQIRQEAISVIYRTRDLIFDLPDFVPHRLEEGEWPSTIHVHDQYGTFVQSFAPTFLRPGAFGSNAYLKLPILKTCPLHLFRSICIEVPAPEPTDAAQLIMTRNRLRWIARLLEKATDGLPHVKVVFREAMDRSWFSNGELTLSHSGLKGLDWIVMDRVSDLSLLICALFPLRRVRSIAIQAPQGLDDECTLLLDELNLSAIKRCKWGEAFSEAFDDWNYIEDLETCEVRFHFLLHSLDTPTAPFLRLEQFASLTHFEVTRMQTLSICNKRLPRCHSIFGLVGQLICCAFVLSPRDRIRSCMCDEVELLPCDRNWYEDPPYFCPAQSRADSACWRWEYFRDKRQYEYGSYCELWNNKNNTKLKKDEERIEEQEIVLPTRLEPTRLRVREWDDKYWISPDYADRISSDDESDSESERWSVPDMSDLEETAYNGCRCFWRGDMWIKKYPEGIVHDEHTMAWAILNSTCETVVSLRNYNFGCVPSRRL